MQGPMPGCLRSPKSIEQGEQPASNFWKANSVVYEHKLHDLDNIVYSRIAVGELHVKTVQTYLR